MPEARIPGPNDKHYDDPDFGIPVGEPGDMTHAGRLAVEYAREARGRHLDTHDTLSTQDATKGNP